MVSCVKEGNVGPDSDAELRNHSLKNVADSKCLSSRYFGQFVASGDYECPLQIFLAGANAIAAQNVLPRKTYI